MSLATVESALERLKVLKRETLPASRRNLEYSLAGYETGGTSLVTLLTAQRDVVDVELEIHHARAALDHALTDLDFAAGSELPKRRVSLTRAADSRRRKPCRKSKLIRPRPSLFRRACARWPSCAGC